MCMSTDNSQDRPDVPARNVPGTSNLPRGNIPDTSDLDSLLEQLAEGNAASVEFTEEEELNLIKIETNVDF